MTFDKSKIKTDFESAIDEIDQATTLSILDLKEAVEVLEHGRDEYYVLIKEIVEKVVDHHSMLEAFMVKNKLPDGLSVLGDTAVKDFKFIKENLDGVVKLIEEFSLNS